MQDAPRPGTAAKRMFRAWSERTRPAKRWSSTSRSLAVVKAGCTAEHGPRIEEWSCSHSVQVNRPFASTHSTAHTTIGLSITNGRLTCARALWWRAARAAPLRISNVSCAVSCVTAYTGVSGGGARRYQHRSMGNACVLGCDRSTGPANHYLSMRGSHARTTQTRVLTHTGASV